MTRLAQALRWWRNRRCECGAPNHNHHPKVIHEGSIPNRHFVVLVRKGWMRLETMHPPKYRLSSSSPEA